MERGGREVRGDQLSLPSPVADAPLWHARSRKTDSLAIWQSLLGNKRERDREGGREGSGGTEGGSEIEKTGSVRDWREELSSHSVFDSGLEH